MASEVIPRVNKAIGLSAAPARQAAQRQPPHRVTRWSSDGVTSYGVFRYFVTAVAGSWLRLDAPPGFSSSLSFRAFAILTALRRDLW